MASASPASRGRPRPFPCGRPLHGGQLGSTFNSLPTAASISRSALEQEPSCLPLGPLRFICAPPRLAPRTQHTVPTSRPVIWPQSPLWPCEATVTLGCGRNPNWRSPWDTWGFLSDLRGGSPREGTSESPGEPVEADVPASSPPAPDDPGESEFLTSFQRRCCWSRRSLAKKNEATTWRQKAPCRAGGGRSSVGPLGSASAMLVLEGHRMVPPVSPLVKRPVVLMHSNVYTVRHRGDA